MSPGFLYDGSVLAGKMIPVWADRMFSVSLVWGFFGRQFSLPASWPWMQAVRTERRRTVSGGRWEHSHRSGGTFS